MSTLRDLFGSDDLNDPGAAAATVSDGLTPYGQTQELYMNVAGATSPIAITDINQDAWGDCYLCSDMIELVRKGPQFITNMIHQNANGTETVKLWEDATTNAPVTWNSTSFKPVYETVDNVFQAGGINSEPYQAAYGGGKEIWPQVIEQAYSQLMGGVQNIANGGYSALAMESLTGNWATWIDPKTFSLTMLERLINQNDTMSFDTPTGVPLTNGLVADHSYAYTGTNVSGPGGSTSTINLANPWGFDNPTPVSIASVAKDFSMVEIAHA